MSAQFQFQATRVCCLAICLATSLLAAAADAPAKATVPPAAEQKKALKLIRDVFKSSYARTGEEEQTALAEKLITQGIDTNNDPASRYVLFDEARNIAVKLGCVKLGFKAIDSVYKYYDIDVVNTKRSFLGETSRFMRKPAQHLSLAKGYLRVAEDLVNTDLYLDAGRLLTLAETAARRARDMPTIAEVRAKSQQVSALQREFLQIRGLLKKLKDAPDDPRCNLRVGQFLCFRKGEWKKGLPHLAKSGDKGLAEIAGKELSPQEKPEQMTALGDAWWGMAKKTRDGVQTEAMVQRGAMWYRKAAAKLSGLAQTSLNRKLETLFAGAKIWELSRSKKEGVSLGGSHINVSEVMTIEFWVATKVEDGALLTKRKTEGDGSITFCVQRSGTHAFGDAPEHFKYASAKTKVADGTWHHLAAVKKDIDVKFYVDGKFQGAFKTRTTLTSRAPWTLGCHPPWKLEGIDAKFCRIRFSKNARYEGDFTPEWTYGKDAETLMFK